MDRTADRTPEQRDTTFDTSKSLDTSTRNEKDDNSSNGQLPAPAYFNEQDDQTGEVYDPYGGKKLGMVRVCIMNDILLKVLTILDCFDLLHKSGRYWYSESSRHVAYNRSCSWHLHELVSHLGHGGMILTLPESLLWAYLRPTLHTS